jgi:RNA-directed DNA polymerase
MLTLRAQVKIYGTLIIMNSNESMTIVDNSKAIWSHIDWSKIESYVRRVQVKIYKSSQAGDTGRMFELQKHLLTSKAAKLLAVRQVTTLNKGRKTAGVDRQLAISSAAKFKLVKLLKIDSTAKPLRRVWIQKPGKKEFRPLSIPVILDRAKQALAKLSLEPQWEALFEPNSYGFRPGRKAQDAIEAIFKNLHYDTNKWVYDADIQKCFHTIDHDALLTKLHTFPLMQRQIKAWLKVGVMKGYVNRRKEGHADVIVPTSMGTPQGGVISPLLANIALHGLENHLKNFVAELPIKPHAGSNAGRKAKKTALGLIRYADDFVLIHRNQHILNLCVKEVHKWLSHMGLYINEEKSSVKDSRQGFYFLGFQIILVGGLKKKDLKVKIQASKSKQKIFLQKISQIIQTSKAVSSYTLISRLNPIIVGWANYYRYCECKNTFTRLSHSIFQKMRAWVFRRHPTKGATWIKEKYFPSNQNYTYSGLTHKDNWVLVGVEKSSKNGIKKNHLVHMIWIQSLNYVKVAGDKSPFDGDHIYWTLRMNKYSHFPTRISNLLRMQKGCCSFCGKKFILSDSLNWEVDHKIPRNQGGGHSYSNLQLIHLHCHHKKTALNFQKDFKLG